MRRSGKRKLNGYKSCKRYNGVALLTLVTLLPLQLFWRIQRSPEIPSRNRTIGTPFFSALNQLLRGGQFSSAKSFGETFAHSVIVDRPDIRPTEIEKKEHLNRPAADPAHLCKARDDLVIAHPKKRAPGRDRADHRSRGKGFHH